MAWQFCGQPLSVGDLKLIEGVAGACAGVSRTELAATVCELLDWRRANARLKTRECRALLGVARPRPRVVRCLQFSSPAWRLAARERWIGRDDAQRARALQRIVNNSRFLILPWVQVHNLASAVLARAARRIVDDWHSAYAVRPLLLETLVDTARFAGTCHRAANWLELGTTSGRGRMDRNYQRHGQAPKTVFVYPLGPDVRRRLQCTDAYVASPPLQSAAAGHL